MKLPVTDWSNVPEGATVERDGIKHTFKSHHPETGMVVTENEFGTIGKLPDGSTFIIEVEPVVKFADKPLMNGLEASILYALLISDDAETRLSTFDKMTNETHTVIVLKGGTP